jgi:hypothetical protein
MSHLKLVINPPKPPRPLPPRAVTIHTGVRYYAESQDLSGLNSIHGVIGDYVVSSECAEVTPVITGSDLTECIFWDADVDLSQLGCDELRVASGQPLPLAGCELKSNRLVLKSAALDGPEVIGDGGETMLTLSPRFDFIFSTDCGAAQLGVINLVSSNRFITLESGDEIGLLKSGDEAAPALYLEGPLDQQPVKLLCDRQEAGVTQTQSFCMEISQLIPDVVGSESVASVTVLEHYCSYFMQRSLPLDDHPVWTPVYAPISWGWSIRVARRYDGEWSIVRRKLMLPTTGHEGLQLPLWHSNSVACSMSLESFLDQQR